MKKRTFAMMTGILVLIGGVVVAQEQAVVQEAPCPAPVSQATAPEEDLSFTTETVSGEISGITERSISIIYDRDYDTGTEYEMLIPLDKDTKLRHKGSIKELKVGDLISIEYEKPGEKSKHKTRAATVSFIQSSVTGLATK
jgi:hypothetical protein